MTGKGYEKYLVNTPVRETGPGIKGRHSPVMTYMNNRLVPDCNKCLEMSWLYEMPEPNPHLFECSFNYDRIVIYVGSDEDNFEDLGGEIEYCIEGQPLVFDTTAALFIPKGTVHGPVTWKRFLRPHLEISLILGPEESSAGWIKSSSERAEQKRSERSRNEDYEKYLVRHPFFLQDTEVTDAMKSPAKIYMSSDLIPECNVYIDFGWIPGMPDPNPPIADHSHDYEELVILAGRDYKNPQVLGAEIEFCINGQPLTFDTTSAIFAPKGILHGPLTWKKFERSHLLMPIVIGTGSLAQAAPAGYKEKGGTA